MFMQFGPKIIEKVFPGDLGRLILPLQYLAETYLRLGDYNMAEPLYKRALEAQNLLQGAYHPDLAQTCFDIADIYLELSHYKVAEEYYRKTLAIEELNLGPDHEDIALTYYNLGICNHWLEKYKIGIEFFDESLKLSPTYEDALTWKNKSLVLLLAKINSTNLSVEDGGVVNVIDVNLEGER